MPVLQKKVTLLAFIINCLEFCIYRYVVHKWFLYTYFCSYTFLCVKRMTACHFCLVELGLDGRITNAVLELKETRFNFDGSTHCLKGCHCSCLCTEFVLCDLHQCQSSMKMIPQGSKIHFNSSLWISSFLSAFLMSKRFITLIFLLSQAQYIFTWSMSIIFFTLK